MWRARIEVPEFKKCCFCIPLRYGLLVWAYFKLVFLVNADLYLTSESIRLFHGKRGFKDYIVLIPLVLVFVLFADILFTILFIVSAHKKNLKGLKVYYYYCLVMLCISTVCFIVYWIFLIEDVIAMSMSLVLQMYILLLVRSEVKKLDNSTNIQNVTNETESIKVDKSDGNVILQEKTEDTESRTKDIGMESTN